MKEPLDSILSGGGEAVSEQVNRAEANANASEGDQSSARASEHLDTQTPEVDLAEAQGDGARMVPHKALHAERQKVRRYTEEVADFRKALAETNASWERRMGQLVEAISPQPEPLRGANQFNLSPPQALL